MMYAKVAIFNFIGMQNLKQLLRKNNIIGTK